MIHKPKISSASDYEFTVHKTKACPRNQIEMDERSLALNCTNVNGYTCLPDKNLTVLLEFCYKRARIAVPKGFCLFLRYSDVDAYDCKRFIHGCPDDDYYSDEIYEYPSCVSVGSGCFFADQSCDRKSAADASTTTTKSKDVDKSTNLDYRVWSLPLGFLIPICTTIGIYFIFRKKRSQRQEKKDMMNYEKIRTTQTGNESFCSAPLLEMPEQRICLGLTDDSEISQLYEVSDQSSIQIECVPAYNIFEQELNSRVELPLDYNACRHELSGNVRSLFDTPADVNSHAKSGFSPSQSINMSANDTETLNQSDNRTYPKRPPIQSISHCML